MTAAPITRFVTLTLAAVFGAGLAGCATDEFGNRRPLNESGAGLAIGAAAGAATGALIGSMRGDAGKGALIGLVGGTIAGGLVGSYMERQRRDFERALSAEIARGDIRVEQLPDDQLLVSMTAATSFNVDSAQVQPGFYSTLDTIAGIVNRYGKTELLIAGHTDSTGSAAHNMDLSQRRAGAVESQFLAAQVIPQRMRTEGLGKTQPMADNGTEAGRALNRRVDITIVPLTDKQTATL